jgi:AcrR family transcriptional regulator
MSGATIIGVVTPFLTEKPRRADAVRNREKVLNAAEAAFAESGLKAQLDDIARRAGVGVGTVCRHFPTKSDLLEAVLIRLYESLLDRANAALDESDPAEAFERFFVALPDFHRRHRAFAEQLASELELAAMPVRDKLMNAMTALVTRAQDVGAIRTDIGPADVSMLFSGIAHATAVVGDLQPMLHERYVRIILDGLRPEHASALPGKPLDFAQLRRMKQRRAR